MVFTDLTSLSALRGPLRGIGPEEAQSNLLVPRYAVIGGSLTLLPSLANGAAASTANGLGAPPHPIWQEGVLSAPQGPWGAVFELALWQTTPEGRHPSLALAVAQHALALGSGRASPFGPHTIPLHVSDAEGMAQSFYFTAHRAPEGVDRYAASDILSGRLPRGRFRDRVLIVGNTLISHDPGASAAMILAEATGALMNRRDWRRPPYLVWLEVLWIVSLTMIPQALGKRRGRQPSGVFTLIALAGLTPPVTWLVWQASSVLFQSGFALLGLLLAWGLVRAWPAAEQGAAAARNRRWSSGFIPKQGDIRSAASSDAGPQPALPERLSTSAVLAENSGDGPILVPAPIEDLTTSDAFPSAAIPPIGRYEIIRAIGRGAMSEVYLGRDPHINRMTAIKCMRFEESFAAEEVNEIKEKFFREAESAGKLSHPNIVTIYDAGEAGDMAYIAMEYLDGVTLLRFTRKSQLLPVRQVVGYLAQVASGLEYAHSQGIVHRDIKPANIMLLPSGKIKITDFGIARIAATSQTQTGVVKGTPYYMSPEQFSGEKVDGRSDIFALGTLLFQLVTGTLPFFSESPAILMNQIMNFPHPNPRAINPKVLPGVIRIIDHALEKDRDNRYQRAAAMAHDLRALGKKIDDHRKRRISQEKDAGVVG
jgi:tRNA A-37 threonylcarbamoyl transferase component Bud32